MSSSSIHLSQAKSGGQLEVTENVFVGGSMGIRALGANVNITYNTIGFYDAAGKQTAQLPGFGIQSYDLLLLKAVTY